jgi:hypothetical protein
VCKWPLKSILDHASMPAIKAIILSPWQQKIVHIYVYSIHFLEESGWVGEVLWEKSLLNVLSGSLLCARTFCSPSSGNNWQP